jgi:YesN/AraC family two-component response regulator
VILASQGDVALALVFAERPDVVFLDVNMPGKNGLDVGRLPIIPVNI